LPGMLLLGLGAGVALNPMLMAAMSDVDESESGLASGVVNTAFMMGGALGLAVLASGAAARSDALQTAGVASSVALNGGYQLAFAAGAAFALLAAGIGAWWMREQAEAVRATV
jgi:MFS family permease